MPIPQGFRFKLAISLAVVANLSCFLFGSTVLAKRNFIEVSHKIRPDELEKLKQHFGTYKEGKNYNEIIDGHGTGLQPPTEKGWEEIAQEAKMVDEIILTDPQRKGVIHIDHSQSKFFPPIGSQGMQGSCTCWAIVYYAKTFQEAEEHNWDLSAADWVGGIYYGHPSSAYQDKIFSPAFIYHQINRGCNCGSSPDDAWDVLQRIGACTWKEMPNDPDDHSSWPSESAWREAPLYRAEADGIRYIDLSSSIQNLRNLLLSVPTILPVIGVDGYQLHEMATLDNYVNPLFNHLNTVVGFDDSKSYVEEGEVRYGAFKIANSWGPTWNGEEDSDGCWWMSYEAMRQRVEYCMYYYDRIGYQPTLVSVFNIDYPERNRCLIRIGSGDLGNPDQVKEFNPKYTNAGPWPFPANDIVFDISELIDGDSSNYWLEAYDRGSSTTGEIKKFSIEYYGNYRSRIPYYTVTSDDPPVPTVQGDCVYAQLSSGIVPQKTVIGVQPDLLDFGETSLGFPKTLKLLVHNVGTTVLDVTGIASSNEHFTVQPTVFTLDVGMTQEVAVVFAPTSLGDQFGVLSITSNDPDDPLIWVLMKGSGNFPPNIGITPTSFDVALSPGQIDLFHTLTITNRGTGPLHYTLTDDLLANFGNRVSRLRLPFTGCTGLTFDGINLWGVDLDDGILYKMDSVSGDVLAQYAIHSSPYGLTFDGTNLWIGSNSSTIYEYDTTGNNIGSFAAPLISQPAIAWDGNYLWLSEASWVDNPTLYQVDTSGIVVRTVNASIGDAVSGATWAYGLLWTIGSADRIARSWDVSFTSALEINSFNSIHNQPCYDGITYDGNYILVSDWDGPIYRYHVDKRWCDYGPASGTIQAGDGVDVAMVFNVTDLPSDDYYANIFVSSNDPLDSLVTIPLHLRVGPAKVVVQFVPDTLDLVPDLPPVECYIELSDGIPVEDITEVTLRGCGGKSMQPYPEPWVVGDYDNDGQEDLMVTFDQLTALRVIDPLHCTSATISGTVTGAGSFQGSDTVWAKSPGSCIAGWVKDNDENPLQGVLVQIEKDTLVVGEDTTTGDGYYSISYVLPDTYKVSVSKEGYGSLAQPGVESIEAETTVVDFQLIPVGLSENRAEDLPQYFSLSQNYPNPFNATTVIRYSLPVDRSRATSRIHVLLEIYNILGEKVATLVNGKQPPGYKSVTWNASGLASGIYLLRLQTGGYTATRRIVLLK